MISPRTRRALAILLLILSILLLLWGIWPLAEATRSMPIPAGEIQLPSPQSFIFIWV